MLFEFLRNTENWRFWFELKTWFVQSQSLPTWKSWIFRDKKTRSPHLWQNCDSNTKCNAINSKLNSKNMRYLSFSNLLIFLPQFLNFSSRFWYWKLICFNCFTADRVRSNDTRNYMIGVALLLGVLSPVIAGKYREFHIKVQKVICRAYWMLLLACFFNSMVFNKSWSDLNHYPNVEFLFTLYKVYMPDACKMRMFDRILMWCWSFKKIFSSSTITCVVVILWLLQQKSEKYFSFKKEW